VYCGHWSILVLQYRIRPVHGKFSVPRPKVIHHTSQSQTAWICFNDIYLVWIFAWWGAHWENKNIQKQHRTILGVYRQLRCVRINYCIIISLYVRDREKRDSQLNFSSQASRKFRVNFDPKSGSSFSRECQKGISLQPYIVWTHAGASLDKQDNNYS
jgi:hypothetical protein